MEEIITSNLKSLRTKKSLTQADMAKKLGVKRQTYINYENNASNLKVSQLIQLADILECKIDDFFVK